MYPSNGEPYGTIDRNGKTQVVAELVLGDLIGTDNQGNEFELTFN